MKNNQEDLLLHNIEKETSRIHGTLENFSQEVKVLEKSCGHLRGQFRQANLLLNDKVSELDKTQKRLDNILKHMTQGALFLQCNGAITLYNKAAERFLGVAADEVQEKFFWEHFEDNFFGFSMRDVLDNQIAPELSFVDLDQRPRFDNPGVVQVLEVTGTILSDEDADLSGLLLILRDLSEVRRLQILANRNHRLQELGEIAATVAHEIRNPLGGIEGFASLLKRDVAGDEAKESMVDQIITGARNLNAIVSNILQYTRPLDLQRRQVNMDALLKEIMDSLCKDPHFADHKFNLHIFPGHQSPLMLSVDAGLIRTLFFNLAINSLQAMPKEGGELSFQWECEGKWVRIVVSNNGDIIPPECLEKIFSPFFTTKSQGNGIGLSEVHKIIRAHGGEIEAFSSKESGTSFVLQFPYRKAIAEPRKR